MPHLRPRHGSRLVPTPFASQPCAQRPRTLVTLALILISFTNAVPSAGTSKASGALPYAKAVVAATVFHHITTGVGAYQHYKLDSHYNTSMAIGVWGNVWLTLSGVVTLAALLSDAGEKNVESVAKKVR
jgi:mannan endo-1,6-alpha-mannosidase